MKTILFVLLGLSMLGTLGVLIAGMVGMARGSDPRRSNQLMQWRVILQACALVIFALLMFLLHGQS